jgi:acetyltransferase EpsM
LTEIVILGAGAFAQQIAWAIHRQGDDRVIGMLDETATRAASFGDIPVGRNIHELEGTLGHSDFRLICGIARQDVRKRWFDEMSGAHEFTTVIDPSALISPDATVGIDVAIMANTVCSISSHVEDHVNIGVLCLISHHVRVGAFANISPGAKLNGSSDIGKFCTIGTNATVLPNCRVGDNSVIGAGAVVAKDIPANVTAVGVPARIIKPSPPLELRQG